MSCSNWEEVTLADISIGNKGSYGIAAPAVEYSKDLFTYLRITDISDDGVLNKDGLMSVDDDNAEKYLLEPNDIVFARTGNSTGRSYFYDGRNGKLVFAGFLIKFSLDPQEVNPKFMKYYTISSVYKNWIASFSTGSTRGNINAKTYGNMKIKLPSREQQNFLVKVLSTLDEKIEVNNQINKTLENMAQAIFKQWFVDFEFPNEDGEPYKTSGGEMVESELGMIPKGWEVGTLKDLIDIIDNRGKTPPQEQEKTEYPIIDVKALAGDSRIINYENCMKYVSKDTYMSWFRSGHPNEGDILISTVGSLAEMKIFYGNIGCIAQNVIAVRCRDISNMFMYQYLNYIKSDLISYNIGSVQPSIKVTHVIKHKILEPNHAILDTFHNYAMNLTTSIYARFLENQNLKDIRDTLLPKLMSGEIRVPLDDEGESS